MKKISKKQKDNVVTLYQETDLPNCTIAKICGIATVSLYSILKERNIEPKRLSGVSMESLDMAVSMYEHGYKVSDILEQCNVSQPRLYAEIDVRGIERRNSSFTTVRKSRIHPKRNKMLKEYQKGKSYAEIGRKFMISPDTVKKYIVQAIENGEIEVSERYATPVDEYLQGVAEVVVNNKQELCIRDVAKALKVDEKKLYYRVKKLKEKSMVRDN